MEAADNVTVAFSPIIEEVVAKRTNNHLQSLEPMVTVFQSAAAS